MIWHIIKNEMKFKHIDLSEYHYEDETEEIEDIVEGIENNPALENIIPPKWHSLVNELVHDYENMDDSNFYEKYKKNNRNRSSVVLTTRV